jgi:hypothetical protein
VLISKTTEEKGIVGLGEGVRANLMSLNGHFEDGQSHAAMPELT